MFAVGCLGGGLIPLESPVALDQETNPSGQSDLDELCAEETYCIVSFLTLLAPGVLEIRLTDRTEELSSLCQTNDMRNSDQIESSKNSSQLRAIGTIQFRQRGEDEGEWHVLEVIRMHARCDEDGVVGIAIRLLDALSGFAIFGDGLVTLPGVEVDALFYDIEREQRANRYQWDCKAAGDWQDLAEAQRGCCVAHVCESLIEIG